MEDESYLIPVKAELLNQKPYVARISRYLFDMLTHSDAGTFRSVLEALDQMEQIPFSRPARTKPASQFRGPILGKLYKFHYTTTGFMRENILLHWNSKDNRREKDKLTEQFNNTARSYKSLEEAWKVAGKIARQVVDGYVTRGDSQKLTGEWIIYQEWNGQKYYLSLGNHSELKDEQALYDRVKAGCAEFPFCFP
ncbi:hypothetical protein LZ023_13020 [Pseudomonas silvicola]|nr:hypothetical protein LZ023_13020 [Pseudomonas silvicola]